MQYIPYFVGFLSFFSLGVCQFSLNDECIKDEIEIENRLKVFFEKVTFYAGPNIGFEVGQWYECNKFCDGHECRE